MFFPFFPRTIYKTRSKVSGQIEVSDWLGSRTLSVQGMIQSGGMVRGVWKKPINKVRSMKSEVRSALVLGLGGGTVVQLIKSQFSKVKIIGIDLDKEIVHVGMEFFGLDKVKGLKIEVADAFKWLDRHVSKSYTSENGFDLVIVDLYLGKLFPQKARSEKFMKKVKQILSKNGILIFNRLKKDSTNTFEKKLRKNFDSIQKVKTSTNIFFLCR